MLIPGRDDGDDIVVNMRAPTPTPMTRQCNNPAPDDDDDGDIASSMVERRQHHHDNNNVTMWANLTHTRTQRRATSSTRPFPNPHSCYHPRRRGRHRTRSHPRGMACRHQLVLMRNGVPQTCCFMDLPHNAHAHSMVVGILYRMYTTEFMNKCIGPFATEKSEAMVVKVAQSSKKSCRVASKFRPLSQNKIAEYSIVCHAIIMCQYI